MIYLQSTTQALQAVLAGAVAATQPDVSVFFYDHIPQLTTTLNRGGSKVGALNSTTDVTICDAPALQGIIRNIHTIFINNRDSATVTVTVKLDDAGTETIYVRQAIATGESLVYEDKAGWQILSPITPPFTDTTPIVKGSADGTKLVRFEVDSLTTGTTRILTAQDKDITILGREDVATQSDQETGSSTTTFVSPGRQQFHPSAAKAWVRFNGTGTLAIAASYNVASVTDNGTGDYTVNFTTAFSSANYCGNISLGKTNVNTTIIPICRIDDAVPPTTSAFRFHTGIPDAGRVFQHEDCSIVMASFFGDQ